MGGVDFSRGQRGSYADTVFARPDQMCKVPEQLDLEVAAALPVAGVTAWIALVEIGRVKPGDRVLILGASGGVGQLARSVLGARTVGVCSGRNVALVQGLGADVVIDYQAGDALALARPHGPFQVVVDCAGGYAASVCRSLLVPGGRHVSVAGDSPLSFLQRLVPPFQSRGVLGRPTRARLEPVVEALAAGRVRVNIVESFALDQAERAQQQSRTGRVTGKLILVP